MSEHTPNFLAEYPENGYGRYCKKPDYNRCCASVADGMWSSKQCSRKASHGPNGAYCKTHDPIAKLAKQEAAHEKFLTDLAASRRKQQFLSDCQDAVRQIAAGHNDPRALAQSILDKLEALQ